MAQLGTIKLQTDSGIVDVPVFDVGDSGGSTLEALRVQTDSGIGFVPLVDPADAATPQEAIRVQTDSGVKAVTDSATVAPPLPDPNNLIARFDARQDGPSGGWSDLTGNGNNLTTVTGSPTTTTVSGVSAVRYNDDAQAFSASDDGEFHIFGLFKREGSGSGNDDTVWGGRGKSLYRFAHRPTDNESMKIDSNENLVSFNNSLDFQPNIWGELIDNGSREIRKNGSSVASDSTTTNSFNGLMVGARDNGPDEFSDVSIVELLVYNRNENSAGNTAAIEKYLDRSTAIL